MAGRRVIYVVALVGLTLLYCFYREWMAWIILLAALLLPVFSLLLSLPAMLLLKTRLLCPEKARVGTPVRTQLQLDCKFPVPPVKYKLRLCNVLTDTRYVGMPGERIPTDHCGLVRLEGCKLYVYDYLRLWRYTVKQPPHLLYVFPRELPMALPAKDSGKRLLRWKPKPGGGFGENHDLRLYRPGDELHHIHWKMSAKTGKLIYREPMEPVLKGYVVTLALSGDSPQLDKKLGQLLWISRTLLQKQLSHQVQCMTGKGLVTFTVENEDTLEKGLKKLLASPRGTDGVANTQRHLWQHHIGGDGDEA